MTYFIKPLIILVLLSISVLLLVPIFFLAKKTIPVRKGMRRILLGSSLVLVFAVPLAWWFDIKRGYRNDYHGLCSPHEPDISFNPCSFDDYMHEFGTGLHGVELFMTELELLLLTLGLVTVTWFFAWLVHWIVARRRKPVEIRS